MGRYAELDAESQVAALRPIAAAGAELLGLPVARIALVHHGYNTTFKVRTNDGADYAVRVLTNSQSSHSNLTAQHAWMHALAHDASLLVPRPVTGPDGASYAVVENDVLDWPITVAAASWLPGSDIDELSLEQAHALGVAMATMHNQAVDWTPPQGSSMFVFDEPLFGDENLLTTLGEVPDGGSQVIQESLARAQLAFEEAMLDPVLVIHADLHSSNLKWHQGALAVFDFDDSGFGTTALDLAICTFYLRDIEGAEEGLRQGYQAMRDLPIIDPAVFEALIASRQLLLANALLATSTASLRAEAQGYLHVTIERLQHWLKVGRFTRLRPRR